MSDLSAYPKQLKKKRNEHGHSQSRGANKFNSQSKHFTLVDSVNVWTAGPNVLQSWSIHRNMIYVMLYDMIYDML